MIIEREILKKLARVQRFECLGAAIPHAVALRLSVLVLLHFIQNLCHTLNVFFMVLESFSASYIGWPIPACAIRSFDIAKVQKISCASKF